MLIHNPETIQEVLVNATRALGMAMPYHEARLQAELLLAHMLQGRRATVLARLDETLSPELAARFAANVARRAQHEPLAYILGHQAFYGLDFLVDRRVLIPRHESEMLVWLALQRMPHVAHARPVVADVGTGSGALALALAHHLSEPKIVASDISPEALAVARINAARLDLTGRVEFAQGDLLDPLQQPFDVLVANLPYIPGRKLKQLPREIREYEPRVALDGGVDGFAVMRRLVEQLESHAARGGVVLLEISEEQGKAAVELVKRVLPNALATLHRDMEGLDRVVEIQLINHANRAQAHQVGLARFASGAEKCGLASGFC